MVASGLGFEVIVRILIEHGADVSLQARSGWTALMDAAWAFGPGWLQRMFASAAIPIPM